MPPATPARTASRMSGASPANAARIASRRHRKIPAFQATGAGPARSAAASFGVGFSTNRATSNAASRAGPLAGGDHVPVACCRARSA